MSLESSHQRAIDRINQSYVPSHSLLSISKNRIKIDSRSMAKMRLLIHGCSVCHKIYYVILLLNRRSQQSGHKLIIVQVHVVNAISELQVQLPR